MIIVEVYRTTVFIIFRKINLIRIISDCFFMRTFFPLQRWHVWGCDCKSQLWWHFFKKLTEYLNMDHKKDYIAFELEYMPFLCV